MVYDCKVTLDIHYSHQTVDASLGVYAEQRLSSIPEGI